MGTWGVGILSDDLAKDVYDEFMELYDDGLSLFDIRSKIEDSFQNMDEEETHLFTLALAKAQWECQALDKDILDRVRYIVQNEIGFESWKKEGIAAYNKRARILNEFLNTIQIPKEKPRKRRKITKAEAPYEPGSCLTFKLLDGSYGGALVVGKDNSHKTEGFNAVAILDLSSNTKPVIEQFLKAGVIQRKSIKGSMENEIVNCPARLHKKQGKGFEVVGSIVLTDQFELSDTYCAWDDLIHIPNRLLFDHSNNLHIGEPKVTVIKMLGKDKGILGKLKKLLY